MMAAFAEVLAAWSRDPAYTLNVTLFHRLPLHPQVGEIVGDFTSVTLLRIDREPGETFTERARRWQESLWQDMGHALVSGVRVMREMAREGRQPFGVVMPVVFTSALSNAGAGAPAGLPDPMSSAGEMVYSVSQTPQVWLNNQVFEEQGTVAFNWEVVEELFPPGVLDAMFRAYVELLEALAGDDEPWDRRSTPAEPEGGPGRARAAVGSPRRPEVYVPPENDLERRLAAMWEDLLRVERVGAEDDFIVLGGCSLQATRLLARVHADWGTIVLPRRFYERPTVRRLAEDIAAHLAHSGASS
jgi:non-ribosomal peptide synthetase component F